MMESVSDVAKRVIALASERGLRIASAESLTGGLVAAALVDAPGASVAYSGGVVSYDTALKHSLLGVEADLLDERGPVDAEVARQMARGARRACAVPASGEKGSESCWADLGIATTGVAGPSPDPQTGQPVGTVWLGVSSARGDRAVSLHLEGDRRAIRAETVRSALDELLNELGAI